MQLLLFAPHTHPCHLSSRTTLMGSCSRQLHSPVPPHLPTSTKKNRAAYKQLDSVHAFISEMFAPKEAANLETYLTKNSYKDVTGLKSMAMGLRALPQAEQAEVLTEMFGSTSIVSNRLKIMSIPNSKHCHMHNIVVSQLAAATRPHMFIA